MKEQFLSAGVNCKGLRCETQLESGSGTQNSIKVYTMYLHTLHVWSQCLQCCLTQCYQQVFVPDK